MIRSVQYFKDLFKTGYKITSENYADWLESFIHASSGVTQSELQAALLDYRPKSATVPASEVSGLAEAINAQITGLIAASEVIRTMQLQLAEMINTRIDPFPQVLSFDYTGSNNTHTLSFVPVAPMSTVITQIDGVEVSRVLSEFTQYKYMGNQVVFAPGVLTPGKNYTIITKYWKYAV